MVVLAQGAEGASGVRPEALMYMNHAKSRSQQRVADPGLFDDLHWLRCSGEDPFNGASGRRCRWWRWTSYVAVGQ